jgi:hypothetical protein
VGGDDRRGCAHGKANMLVRGIESSFASAAVVVVAAVAPFAAAVVAVGWKVDDDNASLLGTTCAERSAAAISGCESSWAVATTISSANLRVKIGEHSRGMNSVSV